MFIVVTVDVDACPLAEFPLYEIYDDATNKLKDDYMATLREYLIQQLEDTSWLNDESTSPFFAAGFSTFLRKENGDVMSLRKPALERYIVQCIRDRVDNVSPLAIPVFIRFMMLDSQLPTRAGVAASRRLRSFAHWCWRGGFTDFRRSIRRWCSGECKFRSDGE